MDSIFYTLSSAESSFTSSSNSDDSSSPEPLTPPSPLTHNTSHSPYHISDIASFAESLQDAANQAFPNRGRTRYHTVNVCLIRWQEDELHVKDEVDYLHDVFDSLYGFNTEIWLIPSTASQIQLTSMTCMFLQKYDEEGNLFIVYYGGHGKIDHARQNQWWSKSTPDSPFVEWSAIQTLFGSAKSDVLVLLDCCAAASSAAGMSISTMETIAACGWETKAPVPGDCSFTHTLIEVLEEWVHKPSFSVAMLHTEVLFLLKQKRPERGIDGRRIEWCSTPVHWINTGNPKASGIELSSLRSTRMTSKVAAREDNPHPRVTTYVDAMELDQEDPESRSNPLSECRDDGNYKVPHVLISIALEGDQGTLDAASCRRWLADFPALAKYATVEGIYRSYSTLMTLSVPVMIWDMLPEHPACAFIGYAVSPNMNTPIIKSELDSSYVYTTPSSSYQKIPHKLCSRKADGRLRSEDSSYGSDLDVDGDNTDDGASVWSSDFGLESISDESSSKKNNKCRTVENPSDDGRLEEVNGTAPTPNEVFFTKNAVSILKIDAMKQSLITSMLKGDEPSPGFEQETSGLASLQKKHFQPISRGRGEKRHDGEGKEGRSQSV